MRFLGDEETLRFFFFFFNFLACVWMKILFYLWYPVLPLSPFFRRSSHWCLFLAASVPLPHSPSLQLCLCLSTLRLTPRVLPVPEVKEGRSGPHGCTIREVLPVARWNKPKLRGTEEVLDKILKLSCTVFKKNTLEQGCSKRNVVHCDGAEPVMVPCTMECLDRPSMQNGCLQRAGSKGVSLKPVSLQGLFVSLPCPVCPSVKKR